MVNLANYGAYIINGGEIIYNEPEALAKAKARGINLPEVGEAKKGTIAYGILAAHNHSESDENLNLRFDKLTSHDITYVGIIQTARASGLTRFPMPYVLTNCHNSLCAVGGTINEDDHMFGLSCAKKYGGIYVPPHQAVIHQFAREMMAECGSMILGSDSHTRYGALGTLACGEGGPELVKQLLGQTYDIRRPEIIAVVLSGRPKYGVGPQDVALAIIGAVFKNGYVNNKVMEFIGEGVTNLSADFRIGIDVMTTETTCLSSIWRTDSCIKEFYETHGRGGAYRELNPAKTAYYDGVISVDLSAVEPMIAMPFHPSNVYTVKNVVENAYDVLDEVENNINMPDSLKKKLKNGRLYVEQGIIAGCAGGGFENICEAANILGGGSIGSNEFSLSVYPASMPIYLELIKNGVAASLIGAGAVVKTAFCGPCFGAGDTPANNAFSVRHSTRNFPNREGSKPGAGQLSFVALMDARSIAATAANKGYLTGADGLDKNNKRSFKYYFDANIYSGRVFDSKGAANPDEPIILGPNIKDWPDMTALSKHLLLRVVSVITDPVTTTDELIPSGETSSYRSNPLGLAEFTLSRKDPEYVGNAKAVVTVAQTLSGLGADRAADAMGIMGDDKDIDVYKNVFEKLAGIDSSFNIGTAGIGSVIYAHKPGDGSAREQAASCQKVLGGLANIAKEYATKRYRSNLINWGMLPLIIKEDMLPFERFDFIFLPDIADAVEKGQAEIKAYVIDKDGGKVTPLSLYMGELTKEERQIILKGCLINYNRV